MQTHDRKVWWVGPNKCIMYFEARQVHCVVEVNGLNGNTSANPYYREFKRTFSCNRDADYSTLFPVSDGQAWCNRIARGAMPTVRND